MYYKSGDNTCQELIYVILKKSLLSLWILLTVKEIQAKMRISKAGVYNLINSGQIPLIKIGNRKLIPKKEFLIWLKEQEVNTK